MAWTIVGVGSNVEIAAATAHALTEPAGVQPGDLLVAVISSRIASATPITLPVGGEWTKVAEENNNNTATTTSATPTGLMAYCIRGSAAPGLTFTHPTNVSVALGRIIAYRNTGGTKALDADNGGVTTATNVTAISVTGLTTTKNGDLIICLRAGGQESTMTGWAATDPSGASGATDTTTNPGSSWIERCDNTTLTGADTATSVFDAVKASIGATGNFTGTASQGSAHVVIAGAFSIEPTPAKAISAPIAGPVFAKSIVYQSLAYTPFIPAAAEEITVDKWYPPLSEPYPAERPLKTGAQQFLAFYSEPIVSFSWFKGLEEPVRTKPRLREAQQQYSAFVKADPFPEAVSIDRWQQPLSDPVRVKRRTADFPYLALVKSDPFPESVTVDRWLLGLSEPVRRIRRTADYPALTFYPLPFVPWDWRPPFSEPVRRLARSAEFPALWFVEAAPFEEATTVDRYWQQLSEPRGRKFPAVQQHALAWSGFTPALGETFTLDKWFNPLSEPVRRKPRSTEFPVLAFSKAAPFEETIFLDKWFASLAEPVRQKLKLRDGLQLTFVLPPNPVVSFSWFRPLEGPIRFRALATSEQQFFAPNPTPIISIGWYGSLSEPLRLKPRRADFPLPAFVKAVPFPETTTADRWFVPFGEPIRQKRRIVEFRQPVFNPFPVPPSEVVTLDKWHRRFDEPVRVRRSLHTAAQQAAWFVKAAPFAEAVSIDRWLRPLNEPVRRRPRLVEGLHLSFTLAPAPVAPAVSFGWFRSLTEPPLRRDSIALRFLYLLNPAPIVSFSWQRDFDRPIQRAGIATNLQRPSWLDAYPIPTVAPDWFGFMPLSEPVRRRGLITALQRYLAYFDFPPRDFGIIRRIGYPSGRNRTGFPTGERTNEVGARNNVGNAKSV